MSPPRKMAPTGSARYAVFRCLGMHLPRYSSGTFSRLGDMSALLYRPDHSFHGQADLTCSVCVHAMSEDALHVAADPCISDSYQNPRLMCRRSLRKQLGRSPGRRVSIWWSSTPPLFWVPRLPFSIQAPPSGELSKQIC